MKIKDIAIGVFLGNLAFGILAALIFWIVTEDAHERVAQSERQSLNDSINAQTSALHHE